MNEVPSYESKNRKLPKFFKNEVIYQNCFKNYYTEKKDIEVRELPKLINHFIDKLFVYDCKALGLSEEQVSLIDLKGETPPRLSEEAH